MSPFHLFLALIAALAGAVAAAALAWFIVPQGRVPVLAVVFVCLITAYGTAVIFFAAVATVLDKVLMVRNLWRAIRDYGTEIESSRQRRD